MSTKPAEPAFVTAGFSLEPEEVRLMCRFDLSDPTDIEPPSDFTDEEAETLCANGVLSSHASEFGTECKVTAFGAGLATFCAHRSAQCPEILTEGVAVLMVYGEDHG